MKRYFQIFSKKLLLTHIYSIPVRIDYRWFLVLGIMGWFVSYTIPEETVSNSLVRFLFGLTTILIFFASIFIHELAHSFVARKEGIQVVEILLHPFGGLARLKHEPRTPSAEFKIAAAGPAASFLLSAVFLGLWLGSAGLRTDLLTPVFFALFVLNLLLAIFNLFPGYPLDGGRVLRAILWSRGKDLNEATVLTGKFGQIIAVTLIVFGVIGIFTTGGIFSGLWAVLVGIFLFDAAAKVIRQILNFEDLTAAQIMEMPVSVSPESTVMEFVDRTLPLYRHLVFPVSEDREFYGLLVLEDVKKNYPRDKWNQTLVKHAMRTIRPEFFVDQATPAGDVISILKQNDAGAVGVIDKNSELVGMIYKGKIRRRN
ncbi:MAG: site-2 protease family protein [Pyrinomonadaceae bacterium]